MTSIRNTVSKRTALYCLDLVEAIVKQDGHLINAAIKNLNAYSSPDEVIIALAAFVAVVMTTEDIAVTRATITAMYSE